MESAPDSPNKSDIFGDPEVLPRIGNKYQVQIPPMITESERLQLLKIPSDKEFINVSHSILMGLPVPVMWIDANVNNHKNGDGFNNNPDCSVKPNGLLGSENSEKSQLNSNKKASEVRVESPDAGLENDEELKSPSVEAGEANRAQVYRSKSCSLVPGLLGDSWSDIKADTFVLGLYVFGKNLVQLKRFMESIEMGEILSFYYGKFYRSDGHQKWSNCRKMSSNCIIGRRIFTGWRQQELLSRLLPHVSEEVQKTMLKTYTVEVTSLEEYVTTLKASAGISMLIKAVGIGKGKEDLTCLAMDPPKANQVSLVLSEKPTGKACAYLTSEDIMKLLTGVRLSKALSNDLFWEAVWPRLVARGWHCERTKNRGCSYSKKCFFLMPGINMISRRKLVKGVHYFDSLIDVLREVAADPKLLELEAEEPGAISYNKEIGPEPETTLDLDDPSDHQRPCYLKPRISTSSTKVVKFTVVDTSLSHGDKSSKVRELRSLPSDYKFPSNVSSISRETKGDSLVDSLDGDSIDMSMIVQKRTNSPYHAKNVCDDSSSGQRMQINGSEAAKARISTSSPNVAKFSVVDTSLAHGDKSSKVRELRGLPSDYKFPSNLSSISRETEGDSLVDSLDGDCIDMSMMVQKRTNSPYHAKDVCDDSSSDQRMQINCSEAAKARISTSSPNVAKFSVVDTGLAHGDKSSKVRELRGLPSDYKYPSNRSSISRETEGDSLVDGDCINMSMMIQKGTDSPYHAKDVCDDSSSDQRKQINGSEAAKARISTSSPNVAKFTVVDTSLAHGDKSCKVRELRGLPSDYKYPSNLNGISRETEGYSLVDLVDGDCIDMSMMVQERTDSHYHAKDVCDDSSSDQRMQINGSEAAKGMMESQENQDTNASNEQQSKRTLKHQSSQRVKPRHANFSVPLVKRQKLTACAKAETSHRVKNVMVGSESKQVEPSCKLDAADACKNVVSDVDLSQEKLLSSSSLAKGTAEEESTGIIHGESDGTKMSPEKIDKPQPRPFIDLNLPPVPSDSEDGEFLTLEVHQIQENPDANILSFSSETNKNVNGAKEQPVVNQRRQSTRNRSLTTKALEALASGFLSTKKWLKITRSQMQENPRSRPSNRSDSRVIVTSNFGSTNTGVDESKEEKVVDGD